MDFGILGPLQVRDDDRRVVDLTAPKQRALLARLLIEHNRPVSADRLIDDLWGDLPRERGLKTLSYHLSRLRDTLQPGRHGSTDSIIETHPSGYRLVVGEQVDGARFETLVDRGREELPEDPAAAARTLREALALWRGDALADFTYEPFAEAEIRRLSELRLGAIAARIEADLALGLHREVVPELERLLAEHPYREDLVADFAVALYRSGRRREALQAVDDLRRRLVEASGLDPSREIQSLEQQLIDEDPALDLMAQARHPVRGYELRDRIGEGAFGVVYASYQASVDREVAVKVIRPRYAHDPGFIRRFEAEAQAVAALEHPSIVPLYDYWREGDGAYLVMRLMRGGSAAGAALPMGSADVAGIARDVGSALEFAHRRGVLHLDVKPSNVLLDEDGRAYLADFGIANVVGWGAEPALSSSPAYMAPELMEGGGGRAVPASDQFGLAVLLRTLLTATNDPTGDLSRERPDVPPGVAAVLERATGEIPGDRFPSVGEFVDSFVAAVHGEPFDLSPMLDVTPYVGLRPFREAEARFFHGRDALVATLVDRLGTSGSGSLMAVVGPSGSGKSSVVKAGLVPAVRAGAIPESQTWFVVQMYPGSRPFEELEAALLKIAVDPPAGLADRLHSGEGGIGTVVKAILPEDGELLLVIDQFEELFSLVESVEVRDAFIAGLVAAIDDPHSRLRVVLTLRADFYDRPLEYRRFGELISRSTVTATPPKESELVEAIVGPAAGVGVRIDDALVQQMVSDVAGQPGGLPLLEYALTEMYERRKGTTIGMDDYGAVGGIRGAVARRAEGLYRDGDAPDRAAIEQVFLRLVTVGEGVADTRRRVALGELRTLAIEEEVLDRVLDAYSRYRLISFDRDPETRGPTVEIAHEALLAEWSRLRGWVDERREDLRFERRLDVAAAEWEESGRNPAYLLAGARLAQFAGWAAITDLALTGRERGYLAVSQGAEDQRLAEERSRAEREEELARQAKRRNRALLLAGLVVVVVGVLASLAVVQWREAEGLRADATAAAQARQLAGAAIAVVDDDPSLAALLAISAAEETATRSGEVLPDVLDAMHWVHRQGQARYPLEAGDILVRPGPRGLFGVFDIPVGTLAAGLFGVAGDRELTPDECARYWGEDTCPDIRTAGAGLEGAVAAPGFVSLVAEGEPPLKGTRLAFESSLDFIEAVTLHAALERTSGGVIIEYRDPEEASELRTSTARPDLVTEPQPGRVPALQGAGAVALNGLVDVAALEAKAGPYLTSMLRVGPDGSWPSATGDVYGLWLDLDLKSLIWYRPQAFADEGYEVPQTWDELVELTDQMVADGVAPWCLGVFSGGASGWPGTDWIEDLVIKGAGPDVYDQWIAHDIPFDDPHLLAAASRFEDMVMDPERVSSPTLRGVSELWFADALNPLMSDPPGCMMYRMADFTTNLISGTWADVQLGVDVDVMPFPTIDPTFADAMSGGGVYATALRDTPEVRAVLASFAAGDWVADANEAPVPGARVWTPPGLNSQDLPEWAPPVFTTLLELQEQAVAADAFRFDASDLMPGPIGSRGSPEGRTLVDELAFNENMGSFFVAMTKLFSDDGATSLAELFRQIEADWQAVEELAAGS